MSALTSQSIIAVGSYRTVDMLLDAFHEAASKADLGTYMGCFHQQGRFLGTDPDENWGAEEFAAYALPHFLKGQGWTYKLIPNTRKVTYFPSADASVTQFCIFDELLMNEMFGTCRGSGSLIFNPHSQSWLVAAYHINFPVPNDIAMEITGRLKSADAKSKEKHSEIAAAELVAQLDLEEKDQVNGKTGKKKKKGKK